MTDGFSPKAQALYAELERRGGGVIDEYLVRTRLGISHGSFSAARRELLDAGVLQLEKEGRHPVYILHGFAEMRAGAVAAAEAASEVRQAVGQAADRKKGGDGQARRSAAAASKAAPGEVSGAASREAGGLQPMAQAVQSMPRVTGAFADMNDWEDALTMELGSCLDISASLTAEGEYTVYSHEYQQSDTYNVQEGECGILVE